MHDSQWSNRRRSGWTQPRDEGHAVVSGLRWMLPLAAFALVVAGGPGPVNRQASQPMPGAGVVLVAADDDDDEGEGEDDDDRDDDVVRARPGRDRASGRSRAGAGRDPRDGERARREPVTGGAVRSAPREHRSPGEQGSLGEHEARGEHEALGERGSAREHEAPGEHGAGAVQVSGEDEGSSRSSEGERDSYSGHAPPAQGDSATDPLLPGLIALTAIAGTAGFIGAAYWLMIKLAPYALPAEPARDPPGTPVCDHGTAVSETEGRPATAPVMVRFGRGGRSAAGWQWRRPRRR